MKFLFEIGIVEDDNVVKILSVLYEKYSNLISLETEIEININTDPKYMIN